MFSISRWNEEDCEKLKKDVEVEFIKKGNRDIYWDDVALFCNKDKYDLGIYKMCLKDVIEIDDFNELLEIDKTYKDYN